MQPLHGGRILSLCVALSAPWALLPAAASVRVAEGEAGSSPIVAPVSLAGHVLDATGRAIARAEVRIPELGRRLYTDAQGAYRFQDLAPGRYTVAVSRLGFAPAMRNVLVSDASGLDFTLIATPFEMEPVLVTATAQAIDPEHATLPHATLSGESLRRNPTVSLAHAIEVLPGVRTLSTGSQVGKPIIRGLTGPRVLVLDDGYRLEDYSWSDEDGPSVDARQVQRVEVIRGPASILYGSDALGGVVNAIPAELPESADGVTTTRAALEAYGASNNREVGSAVRLEGASGRYGWRLHGIGRVAGDLRTPAGRLQNTGFGAMNGEAAFGVRGTTGSASLRYVRYGGEFKLLEAGGPAVGGRDEGGPERKLGDDRVQLGARYQVSGIRLEGRVQWQRHSLVEISDEPGSTSGNGKESEQFNLSLETSTLELRAHHATDRLSGIFGVAGLEQANDSRGPIPLVPDAHMASGAVFGLEQLTLGRWTLAAGARLDLRHIDNDGNRIIRVRDQSRNDTQGSGNAGVVYRPRPELSLAFDAGRAWRAPTLFELFANGPRLGEARFEIGRSDLKPEAGIGLDASVRWQGRRVRGEVAGYRNRIRDYIFITPTNEFRDSLRVFRHEQADAVLLGTEASAELEATRHVALHARYDYVWGQNESPEAPQPLPLVPPARGVLGFEIGWPQVGSERRSEVGAEVELVAEQTRRSAFDSPAAAYALLHLDAGMSRRWAGRQVQVDIAARNVTNVRYRDYLSRYKLFALEQGRNVLLRLSTGF